MKEQTYIITEQERLNLIIALDKLVGSRQLANFFEFELPARDQVIKEEDSNDK